MYLMKISHVIRGEEWLPSLPLHVLLYRSFGWEAEMPEFTGFAIIGETLSTPMAGGEGIEDTTSQKDIDEQLPQDTETTDTGEDVIPGPGLLIGLLSIWIAVQVLQKKILP